MSQQTKDRAGKHKETVSRNNSMGWGLALGLLGISSLIAVEPGKIAPPPAAHWRVEYNYGSEKKSNAQSTGPDRSATAESMARLAATEYEVFKDTAKITSFFENGTEETKYINGEYLYRQDRETKRPMIEPIASDETEYQCRKGYPEFSIPLEKYYVETVEAFGQKCFHYRVEPQTSGQPAEEADGRVWEGWISSVSGRPVAFQKGDISGKFVFLPPPAGPVNLHQIYVDLATATFKTPPPPGSLAGKKR